MPGSPAIATFASPPAACAKWRSLRRQLSRPVGVLCGLVLLIAASLKLYGANVSPFAQYGHLITAVVQTVAVAWEACLGLWLISGASRRSSWSMAAATFVLFAVVSGYLGVVGRAKCGCFGAIEASPWHAFGVDVTALVALFLFRPTAGDQPESPEARRRWASEDAFLGLGAAVLAGGTIAFTSFLYGGPAAAIARLRGERVSVAPSAIDLGDVAAPGQRDESIQLVNRTSKPIRILGTNLGCTCMLTSQLPIHLAPDEPTPVGLRIRLTKEAGSFARQVYFLTDDDEQPYLVVAYYGQVVSP